jgi:hypothetical protein
MGYKILGYIVWHGAKWYAGRWASQNKRGLVIAGAGAGALLLVGAGAAVASKRGGE